MRALISFLLCLAVATGQSISMSVGTIAHYNDQHGGRNSWPNNGRYFDGDSQNPTLCSDNVTYAILADGLGPNASLSGGRNIFIVSVSDYVSPSGGALITVRNSLDDHGTITQLNTNGWSDSSSWKPGGLVCVTVNGVERMVLSIWRQAYPANTGANGSLVWSGDRGATWCSFAHTNHTTGACTITPSATGDAPTNGQQMFQSMGIRDLKFMQYTKSGDTGAVVENNDVWLYAFGEGATLADTYLYRVRLADFFKNDETLYQAYKTGSCTADASWDSVHPFSNRVGISGLSGLSNLVGQPIYIAAAHMYVISLIDSSNNNVFLSAPSICGPYTQIASISVDDAIVQAWFYPTLKSLTNVSAGTTTVVWGSGAGTQHRTSDPDTNKYAWHFNTMTFTYPPPATSVTVSGKSAWSGKTTVQ